MYILNINNNIIYIKCKFFSQFSLPTLMHAEIRLIRKSIKSSHLAGPSTSSNMQTHLLMQFTFVAIEIQRSRLLSPRQNERCMVFDT